MVAMNAMDISPKKKRLIGPAGLNEPKASGPLSIMQLID
jgi:hypothetical protein